MVRPKGPGEIQRSPEVEVGIRHFRFVMCRATITEALGGEMEFEFFHWWFNSIFLACACLTMLLFYGQYKQRIQDTDQLPIYYRSKE